MQRRKFIKNSLLTSLGLVFGANSLLANSQSKRVQSFAIPAAQQHIRHGLFQQNEVALLNGVCKIQRDVFLNAAEGNLMHLSIQLDGCLLNLSLAANKIYLTTVSGVQNYTLGIEKQLNFVLNSKVEGHLINLVAAEYFELKAGTKQEAILIPIKGELTVNEQFLNTEKGGYIAQTNRINIQSKTDSLLLVLSK